MIGLGNLINRLLESLAITVVVYLITNKELSLKELTLLGLTIVTINLLLDLFAPEVAMGARQGTGFGLGYMQIAGSDITLPYQYFNQSPQKDLPDKKDLDLEPLSQPIWSEYPSNNP